jgi:probable F420-dependent oxidoreductase
MRLETMLPLGKVDPGLRTPSTPLDIFTVEEAARAVEELGYSGLVVEETKDDPFTLLTLAARSTTDLRLGTSVAIAFARSPTVTALNAWTLQKLSRGRFTLGIGSQVKPHIERRYGMPWSAPAPRMRDYVHAIRAVWDCWQNGTKLDYRSEHYDLSLMVPLFDAGPITHPEIPIQVAAVNSAMAGVAGEVADGIRLHPVCTPSYVRSVLLPSIRRGAARSGRSLSSFRVCMKPLVAAARTEEDLEAKVRDARARIAFYASTPGYFAAFEHLGLEDLATEARSLSRSQDWETLAQLIDDDVLDQFVIVGTYDTVVDQLVERYGGVVTDIEFSIAVASASDRELLREMVTTIHGTSDKRAREAIVGADGSAARDTVAFTNPAHHEPAARS